MKDELSTIFATITRTGLVPRGALRLEESEQAGELVDAQTLVLVGMAGRICWDAFAGSPEAQDGRADPLDRWSCRLIEAIAGELGACAVFPFGRPPFLPFQRWAQRAEPVHASPIGILIHPRYGLWHSYRGALGFRAALAIPEPLAVPSPCESCSERWCLKACPVGAFSEAGYDSAACVACLEGAAGADCMDLGCRARRACPVGASQSYAPEHANFLMRAFLSAHGV
jgi:hypothetical protein